MDNLSVLRLVYNQKYSMDGMQIDIPLPCPSCGGKMYSVSYETSLSILKKRIWHVCKECDFERNSEDFKKSICCA
ncbi:MAG: hypothetical protein OEM18_03905 [Nitrosopumilus sp.]|jgi:C4-type Zn-finger protein|nr:hypothetical protein [Nitrosopumilus sp.]